MLDTMTFTKVASALIGALLVVLLGNWGASELYSTHSDKELAYAIEVEESGAVEEDVAEVSFEELLANADAGKGQRVFRQCSSCHQLVAGENRAGPYLFGILDRPKAAAEGFGYSDTLAGMGGAWTAENLDGFIEKPGDYAPGTSMKFRGIKDAEDRANLIAYLATIQ